MATHAPLRLISISAVLSAGLALTACTAAASPAPSVTVTSPSPTVTATATATAAPTSTPTPTPTATAATSYDLDAVYTACVQAAAEVEGLAGEPVGYDPAQVQLASENFYLKDQFAGDQTALAFYYTFDPDSDDLPDTVPTLCSVSGPFDAPLVEYVRSLT